jgi:hypothetical protein
MGVPVRSTNDKVMNQPSILSSRPERTRISYYASPDRTTCAAFFEESRMQFDNATNVDRKSGVAQWRDLQFLPSTLRLGRPTLSPSVLGFCCASPTFFAA